MALLRKVMAIDSGAFNTKVVTDIGDAIFRTRYSPRHTDAGYLGSDTYNATIDGKELTIGNNATYSDKNEGKHTDPHIWSTLTAMALLRGDADEIILGYGESFNKYVQNRQKELISNKLIGDHIVEIENNKGQKEVHEFKIIKVHVLPEGTGHILSNLKANQGVRYVFDWGGSTINVLEIVNGRPTERSQSLQLGAYNINALVGSAISKAGLGRFSDEQIREWVEKGCPNIHIQREIDNVIEDQLYKIDDALSGFGINLHDYLEVDFVGGASALFESQIKKHWACARIQPDCVMSNVRGFYEFMRLKYGSQAR
jgi:hypothetical protein